MFFKEVVVLMAELVKQYGEVLAKDIQAFMLHAKRKTMKPEDVLLCVRRNPSLSLKLEKKIQEHKDLSSAKKRKSSSAKKSKAKESDLDNIDVENMDDEI